MEAIATVLFTLAAIGVGWAICAGCRAFARWVGSVDHPSTPQERS